MNGERFVVRSVRGWLTARKGGNDPEQVAFVVLDSAVCYRRCGEVGSENRTHARAEDAARALAAELEAECAA